MTARDTLPVWRRFAVHRETTPNGLTMRGVTVFGVTFAMTVSPDGGWHLKGRVLPNFEIQRDDSDDTVKRFMRGRSSMIAYAQPEGDESS